MHFTHGLVCGKGKTDSSDEDGCMIQADIKSVGSIPEM